MAQHSSKEIPAGKTVPDGIAEQIRAEEALERMGSLARIGTWEYSPHDRKFSWSGEVFRIFEAPDDLALNLDKVLNFFPGESSEIMRRAIDLSVEQGKSFSRDSEIITASGKHKWIRTLGETARAGGAGPHHLFGTMQDISELRLLNQVSQENELTLNQVEQITHIGHWSVNVVDGSFFHSDETKRIFGYEPSEYALSVEDAINAYHPDDREAVIRYFNRAVETGQGYEFDLRVIQPDGKIRYVHSNGYAEKNGDGKVTRVYGVFQDITEIKQSVMLLEQSRMLLNASLESQKDTILLSIDRDFRYLFFNKAHADIMRQSYGKDVQIGMCILDCITSDEDREAARINYGRALKGESHSNIRVFGDSKKAWFESFFNPILDTNNEIIGATAMARDISERKLAEEAIIESRNRYHALFEQAGDGIFTLDQSGRILTINETFARMHGYSEDEMKKLSLNMLDVEGNDRFPERISRIMAGETLSFEVEHFHKDGHIFPMLVTANLINVGKERFVIAIHRDLTERKRMEKELQKVQKLDALGLLAGGIAHDFNNLMSGIFGYIEMANMELKEGKAAHFLSKAQNTLDRARGLTQQLLTFAKGGAPIREFAALFPVVKEAVQFALSGSNVSSRFDVPDNLWQCNFDRNQIGQVIDNVVINAKQAMSGGGEIVVSGRNVTIGPGGRTGALLPDGAYVRISIEDRGVGIPKEVLPRIFDPFYTTKETGHGLGLATCYSIIKRHGGCIEVESEPGKGSTFHLFLPAVKGSAVSSRERPSTSHRGSGTFLVMDDEEVVRETVGGMLGSFGYSVVFRENGDAAIGFVAAETEAKRKLAGMIFDLTIPGGRGGMETIAEIRKFDPATPAFVMSGYAEDPVMASPGDHGFTASICKPFRKTELSEMLNRHMRPEI